jgi:PAS domain S-box-containing protein
MSPADPKGVDAIDVAALLAGTPFAAALRTGAPLLVAAIDPLRIRFATDEAMTLLGAKSLAEVEARALGGDSLGARRLRQLARTLAAGAPRLELLRFFADRRPVSATLACAKLVDVAGQAYLVAAWPAPGQASDSPEALGGAVVAPAAAPLFVRTEPELERFLWRVDQHLRFGAPATALTAMLGAHAPQLGESLGALKARTGLDEDGRLAAALAAKATFSGLRLAWPQGGGKAPRTLLISGAPILDAGQRFMGFRGFGQFVAASAAEGAVSDAALSPPPIDPSAASAETSSGIRTSPPPAAGSEPRTEAPTAARPGGSNERPVEVAPMRAAFGPASAPNVVPIRPDLRSFAVVEESGGAEDEQSVELTAREKSAFREIARALGANVGADRGADGSAEEGVETDGSNARGGLPDPTEPPASSPEAPPAIASQAVNDEMAANIAALADRLPIGALVARGQEALYLNGTLLDLLGYSDIEHFRTAAGVARMFSGGDTGSGVLLDCEGASIPVDSHAQTIRWGGESATLFSFRRSAAAEIAPRLHALEKEGRTHEAQARELTAILDTATDGVLVLDHLGAILTLNRSAEALFGVDQRDVRGEQFLTLFTPESREAASASFEALRASGLANLVNDGRELIGRGQRGRVIPLFVTMGRLGAAAEAKICAVLRDMTHWKTVERDLDEARRQAERASALKSEFLAKISHELRTPLNAIIGFAEVIMEERFGPIENERYKDYVKDIHTSGGHVMSLVNDLLDLSKIEAGKIDLTLAPLDANLIIQECVALMQPQAASERVIMRLSLAETLPRIVADERSLRQIMLNLMSNAVKFNEPGGQVIVSTATNDSGQAVIRVRDTGVGMSESEIATALEPFGQVASTLRPGGTGLGLPLTKALTEANRAAFSIKSRKEQGTLIELSFPTTPAAAAQ